MNIETKCVTCLTRDKEIGPYCKQCYEQYIKPMEQQNAAPQQPQVPVPPVQPQATTMSIPKQDETFEKYSLELGDGKIMDVKVGEQSGMIIAVIVDAKGNESTPKTFSDIAEFSETVNSMKDQIKKEKEYVESVKSAVSELGFSKK